VVRRPRRRVPLLREDASDLRHGRPQRVSADLIRIAVRAARKGPIDEGDLGRLLAALKKAFSGTGQPLPGAHGVTVWYLEDGFQSVPGGSRVVYSGTETDKQPVSEDVQAAQLTAAVELAYCQPAVGAFFNFELRDDSSLTGWQSGLLRPDWSAKPAFVAYLEALAAARTGTIDCAAQ
jgi:hypothetical protein